MRLAVIVCRGSRIIPVPTQRSEWSAVVATRMVQSACNLMHSRLAVSSSCGFTVKQG